MYLIYFYVLFGGKLSQFKARILKEAKVKLEQQTCALLERK